MAEGYVKILSSILDSSIWDHSDDVVRVWLTLLAMADRDGYVGASISGISNRSRTVSKERVAECLEMFQSPDDESRSDEYDGRRIQKVERGWLILNYKRVRDMHGEETARARKREWWHRNRGASVKGRSKSEPPPPLPLDSSNSSLSSETSYHGSGSVVGSGSEDPDRARDKISCPVDLRLTDDQRGALETSMIPGWAIDAITASFVASAVADPSDTRQLIHWQKCLAKAVAGQWNDPKKRPKKPEEKAKQTGGKPGQSWHPDGYWYYPPGAKVV